MILACGEALMDVLIDAQGNEQPVPGGGPFNTARALGRLRIPAAFLGRLSEDRYGQRLAAELVAAGVSLDFASRGPEPTTVALATVDAAGVAQYEFQAEGTSARNLRLEMLPTSLGSEVEALHVGTLGLVLEPMATTLIALVRREQGRCLVMVDPNIRAQLIAHRSCYRRRLEEEVFPSTTILKASEEDLAWLYPGLRLESACGHILDRGPRLVIATRGADGALGVTRYAEVHVPVPPIEIVDTIGAGDIFGAGLLAWLRDHRLLHPDLGLDAGNLRAALTFACRAAAWTCTRTGAEPPARRDLDGADGDVSRRAAQPARRCEPGRQAAH